MQIGDQLLINVGGGLKVPTMAEQLTARLKTLKPEENYLLVPDNVTTVLNAIGLYVYVYWQLLLVQQRLNQRVSTQDTKQIGGAYGYTFDVGETSQAKRPEEGRRESVSPK